MLIEGGSFMADKIMREKEACLLSKTICWLNTRHLMSSYFLKAEQVEGAKGLKTWTSIKHLSLCLWSFFLSGACFVLYQTSIRTLPLICSLKSAANVQSCPPHYFQHSERGHCCQWFLGWLIRVEEATYKATKPRHLV